MIEKIRKQYYLNHSIEPHITLVYPFKINEQKKLYEHIKKYLKDFETFEITRRGLPKSERGYYLYLLVDEGNEKTIRVFQRLNLGILGGFKNPDMPHFVPHLTLGIF